MLTEKVTFSLPCLKSLVNSDTSCVFCKTNFRRSLTLLPLHLHDLKQSVREILSSKVTTYDIELGGIILSHKNVKICSSVEMNDEGHFTLGYAADIYIFTPQIGSILSGRINKMGRDALGCLVHSVFNVALPRPRNEEDGSKKWIGSKAFIGQTVTFSVVKLDFTRRLPYIRGHLMHLEDKVTTDDDGADSGMGYQESNDGCSLLSVIEPQASGEKIPSVPSMKRKRDLNSSLTSSPKSKKRRFKGNSSDEGLSGEESVSVDATKLGIQKSLINKDKVKKKKRFSLENFVETEFDDISLKIKKEPTDETSSDVSTPSKSKKKKKDKVSPSTSSFTNLEKLSSSLLTEALDKNKFKKERATEDSEGDKSTVGSFSGISKLKKKEPLPKRTDSNAMETLSFSLLKEAMELNSLKQEVEGLTSDQLQKVTLNKPDELPHKKMKKKKKHTHDDEMEHLTKLKLNEAEQRVASEGIGNFSEKSEIVIKKDKNKKNKNDTVKKLVESNFPMPIKTEVEDTVDMKKKKKKHKEITDINEISSSLLDQAMKDIAVKSKKENH